MGPSVTDGEGEKLWKHLISYLASGVFNTVSLTGAADGKTEILAVYSADRLCVGRGCSGRTGRQSYCRASDNPGSADSARPDERNKHRVENICLACIGYLTDVFLNNVSSGSNRVSATDQCCGTDPMLRPLVLRSIFYYTSSVYGAVKTSFIPEASPAPVSGRREPDPLRPAGKSVLICGDISASHLNGTVGRIQYKGYSAELCAFLSMSDCQQHPYCPVCEGYPERRKHEGRDAAAGIDEKLHIRSGIYGGRDERLPP